MHPGARSGMLAQWECSRAVCESGLKGRVRSSTAGGLRAGSPCAGTREWGRPASRRRASRQLTEVLHGWGGCLKVAPAHSMTIISRATRFWRPVHTPLMYLLSRTGSGPAGWPCHWSVREPGMSDVFTCETRPGRRSCPSRSSAPRRNHRPSSRRCPVRRRALR